MPFPKTAQLQLGLNFRPGPENILGTRVHIATRIPEHDGQPSTFLTVVLRDMTPANWDGQLPVHRLVVDEDSSGNESVQRIIAEHQAKLKQACDTCGDDIHLKQLIAEEMSKPLTIWLEFASAQWIASMDDNVYLCAAKGIREPIGDIFQLGIL